MRRPFEITINQAPPLDPDPIEILTESPLPDGEVGEPYIEAIEAAGGADLLVYSLASGVLPDGLSLSPTGLISGTPTAAGTTSFEIEVADVGVPTDPPVELTDPPVEPTDPLVIVEPSSYISHDFEDGNLAPFTGRWADPVVGEWGVSVSGTFAVRAKKWSGSDGASKLTHDRSGLTPLNPPLEPTGVYQRWSQLFPRDVYDALAAGTIAQIKFLLNRGGPGGWLMGIVGRQSGAGNNTEIVFLQDANTGLLPSSPGRTGKQNSHTGIHIVPDTWMKFRTWFFHDGTEGRAKLWIDGNEVFDVSGPLLGTADASGAYDWELGVAWVQGNTSGVDAVVYVDDVSMSPQQKEAGQ